MTMRLRTALLLSPRKRPAIDLHDVSHLTLRVLPIDTDILNHMNNGVYLSIMDLGRLDLLNRSGLLRTMRSSGIYPVVASETISFRKSLQPWQKYRLETQIVGYDEKSAFIEQRFTVGGEVFAIGFIRARLLRKGGGALSIAEMAEFLNVDTASVVAPDSLTLWAQTFALPSSNTRYPSVWP